jgi:integrase
VGVEYTSDLRHSQKPCSEGISGTNPAEPKVGGQRSAAHLPHICRGTLRSVAIDLVVSGILDDRRIRKQFRGAAHREARAFAKTLSKTTTVYAARTRVDGRQVTRHFDRKVDAETWLAEQTVGRRRGSAIVPMRSQVTVEVYGRRYLERHRVNLAENTAELYDHLFTKHIVPRLGVTAVVELTTEDVDIWFGGLRAAVPSTAAKAYRLLRQIMNSAVEDGLRAGSPCRIKNGGREPESDRPSISVGEVAALAAAMPANLQLAVLLACWTSLRRGEILDLRRRDIDVGAGTVMIGQTKVATVKNNVVVKEPTSPAGQRIVHVPPHVLAAVEAHLDDHVGAAPDDAVFDCTIQEFHAAWDGARRSIEREDLHFGDLRLAGFTLAAVAGATIAEIMHRAGGSTPTTARRYHRATVDRDRALAAAIAELAQSGEPLPPST